MKVDGGGGVAGGQQRTGGAESEIWKNCFFWPHNSLQSNKHCFITVAITVEIIMILINLYSCVCENPAPEVTAYFILVLKTAVLPPTHARRQCEINPCQPLPLLYLARLSHPLIVCGLPSAAWETANAQRSPGSDVSHLRSVTPLQLVGSSLFMVYSCPSCFLFFSAAQCGLKNCNWSLTSGWHIEITSQPHEENILIYETWYRHTCLHMALSWVGGREQM